MTLEELGNLVGVGKSTVRKWENGMINDMRRSNIIKLANALGVSVNYLMDWEPRQEETEKGELIGTVMKDNATITMIESYYSLSDADKSAIRQIIHSLANAKRE
jgi:transcriptional regulator with XRE-family HTH domain